MPDFAFERCAAGIVCGIDEAGRGPLAGPVVAAAVIIDRRRFRGELRRVLDDSKVLSRELRESCCRGLFAGARIGAVRIGIGAASVARDRPDQHPAREPRRDGAGGRRAWRCGPTSPSSTAMSRRNLPCPVKTIVKGDALSFSIAAASVVAKVTRDRIMHQLGARAIPATAGRPMSAMRQPSMARRSGGSASPRIIGARSSRFAWRFRVPPISLPCSKPAHLPKRANRRNRGNCPRN